MGASLAWTRLASKFVLQWQKAVPALGRQRGKRRTLPIDDRPALECAGRNELRDKGHGLGAELVLPKLLNMRCWRLARWALPWLPASVLAEAANSERRFPEKRERTPEL